MKGANWFTEKTSCVHLLIFQHDNQCLAGNISTRLAGVIPLLVLVLVVLNTDSRVK